MAPGNARQKYMMILLGICLCEGKITPLVGGNGKMVVNLRRRYLKKPKYVYRRRFTVIYYYYTFRKKHSSIATVWNIPPSCVTTKGSPVYYMKTRTAHDNRMVECLRLNTNHVRLQGTRNKTLVSDSSDFHTSISWAFFCCSFFRSFLWNFGWPSTSIRHTHTCPLHYAEHGPAGKWQFLRRMSVPLR